MLPGLLAGTWPQGSAPRLTFVLQPSAFQGLQSLLMPGIAGPVKRKGRKSSPSPADHTGRDRCTARRQPFIS